MHAKGTARVLPPCFPRRPATVCDAARQYRACTVPARAQQVHRISYSTPTLNPSQTVRKELQIPARTQVGYRVGYRLGVRAETVSEPRNIFQADTPIRRHPATAGDRVCRLLELAQALRRDPHTAWVGEGFENFLEQGGDLARHLGIAPGVGRSNETAKAVIRRQRISAALASLLQTLGGGHTCRVRHVSMLLLGKIEPSDPTQAALVEELRQLNCPKSRSRLHELLSGGIGIVSDG